MAVKMDDFLLEYFRRLHFNAMSIEQFVQFCEYVKAKDFSGNMKEWAETLLEKDSATGQYIQVNKLYIRKSLPDPTDAAGGYELSDEEWQKLFRAFQNTFRAMAANKNSFKYNDKAIKFLDQYFGDNTKLFSNPTASPEATAQIQVLKQLLTDKRSQLQSMLGGYLSDDFTYQDLLNGIESKKYDTDPKFQKKLQDIASALAWNIESNPNVKAALGINDAPDFSAITDPSRFEASGITTGRLDAFKAQYGELLGELYKNSKAYEAFSANDSSKISKKLEEAKSRMQYGDKQSDDYVPPKRKDELTFPQRMFDEWGKTYSECLEKYTKLKGDRLYFSPQAKQIVAAIDKQKIKPTDGLGKVIENASKIKDALKYKSPTAAKHFGWFATTMEELKSTMPKAFNGALKNGRQLRALIEEMILKAVREGKMAEAKTAMEVLSVIKYGYTTSKIMDTLGKTDLSIFSDKGLSWNKNEGVKFVTTALDKSIKAAFMGIGYGITIAGNAYKLSGSKFNGNRDRLKSAQESWEQQTLDAYHDITQQQQYDRDMRDANQQTLDNMATNAAFPHGGINDANIAQHRDDLAQSQSREERLNMRLDDARKQQTEIPNKINEIQQQITQNAAAQVQTNNEITATNNRINWLQSEITNPATPAANLPTYQNELNYLQNAVLPYYTNQLNQIQAQQVSLNRNLNRYQRLQANMGNIITNRENALTQKQRENQRTEIRLNAWTDAKDTVNYLSERITKRETAIAEWDDKHRDQYKELMAYWDFLETGRNTHSGKMYSWMPGNAKNKQAAFDKNKDAMMANYLADYDYTS